jgi:hypothetical protein
MAWEIVYPLGALLLFIAIAYGVVQSRRRSRREKAITETATRELYEHPARYESETHEALEEAAKREQQRQKEQG